MEKKEMKRSRRSLHTIQIAVGATDKENLTRKVVPKKKAVMNNTKNINIKKNVNSNSNNKNEHDSTSNIIEIKNNINKTKTQTETLPVKLTAQDLTNDNPGENYWQSLAESRRVALESALKENIDLHNKMTELEYENSRLKSMLDEARSLVEVLTDMVEEKEGNSTAFEEQDASALDETKDGSNSETDNDVSFQSCL